MNTGRPPLVFSRRDQLGFLIGDVAHLVVFLRPSKPLSSLLEPQLKIRLSAQSPGGQPARRRAGRGLGHEKNKLWLSAYWGPGASKALAH